MEQKYKCKGCNTEFIISASFATISLLPVYCPVCMTDDVKKIYEMPNVILKGKDFYKNHNRKDDIDGRD